MRALSVRVSVCVLVFNLTDFIVCVFEVGVHVGVLILTLVCVCEVIVGVRRAVLCLCVSVCVLWMSVCVHDLVDPAPEAADAGVQRRGGGVGTAVTSGDNSCEHPSTCLLLTHQPASRVALATITMEEAGVWGTAGTKCAVTGEAVAIALLTLP